LDKNTYEIRFCELISASQDSMANHSFYAGMKMPGES
jgi:hypothetical protein